LLSFKYFTAFNNILVILGTEVLDVSNMDLFFHLNSKPIVGGRFKTRGCTSLATFRLRKSKYPAIPNLYSIFGTL
jgi:hypothetical protein